MVVLDSSQKQCTNIDPKPSTFHIVKSLYLMNNNVNHMKKEKPVHLFMTFTNQRTHQLYATIKPKLLLNHLGYKDHIYLAVVSKTCILSGDFFLLVVWYLFNCNLLVRLLQPPKTRLHKVPKDNQQNSNMVILLLLVLLEHQDLNFNYCMK